VPSAPPAPVPTDVETERRLAKALKQLETFGQEVPAVDPQEPPLYSSDLAGNLRLNIAGIDKGGSVTAGVILPVETKPKPDPKPSAEELAAAEAEKQRIAKIDEDYAEVQKRYNRPLDVYERNMPRHQVKSRIAYDN